MCDERPTTTTVLEALSIRPLVTLGTMQLDMEAVVRAAAAAGPGAITSEVRVFLHRYSSRISPGLMKVLILLTGWHKLRDSLAVT